jgi:hypothetical protein
VAGKTFRGVGEDGAPSSHIGQDDDSRPRLIDEDDSRGLHSGPTVVDDQKVAEVLKKLRSLDRAPGPLTGVTEIVVDGSSSEKTRLDDREIPLDSGPVGAAKQPESGPASLEDVMYPLKRLTSVGRPSTPTDGQPVNVAAGLARGTLFGHSIHVPDVNAPDAAEVELSSGGIQFLEGAPAALQPFPLADRPAVVVPPPTSQARLHAHTPYPPDQHTQLVGPPSRAFKRFIAFVGGLSLAGAGIWAWWQYGGGKGHNTTPPPAVATPVATPPSIDPMPTATAPTAAAPRPEPPPAAEPAAPAAKPAAAPDPEPTAAAAAPPEERAHARSSSRSRARRSAAERRAAAKPAAAPEDDAQAAKPSHAQKKPPVAEDPDATMAPSGE